MSSHSIPKVQGRLRERLGSRPTARLRQAGQTPAVIYGHQQPPSHISLDRDTVADLLHQHAHLIEVDTGQQTEACLIKDLQWDHLGAQVQHVDLARVDLTEQVTTSVAIELVGDPVGLKESGAFLDHPVNEIQVRCLATQIPDQIRVDISGLGIGNTLTVADLHLPEGVTTPEDPETLVAAIHVVAEESEEAEAAPAEGEPQVITRKPEAE